MDYQINHLIEGVSFTTRGVNFMVDGGYMRLSMLYPSDEANAEFTYRSFRESFKLTPISYVKADQAFEDPRGISFYPPKGWRQQRTQNPAQVAVFNNLTRNIQLLSAGTPAYTCDNFLAEIDSSGRLKSSTNVSLNGKKFLKIINYIDVPQYNVRLTNASYCINGPSGAVILGGSVEEAIFPRWAEVIEGTAATLQLK